MRYYLGLVVLLVGASPRAMAQTYGLEVAFRSGHADRGFLINDRPAIQPVTWLTWSRAEFSVWGSLPLRENSDGSRPQIMEMELARHDELGKLALAPALRMYFYHDALSHERDRSLEGWLLLSYGFGPVRLFTNHSLDVLTYPGSYFVDAGIESEHELFSALELGGSVAAGWASWRFNNAWAGVPKSTFNRVLAETWLTVSLGSFYVEPHLEFSTTIDPAVRAELSHPTYLLIRLGVGGEF